MNEQPHTPGRLLRRGDWIETWLVERGAGGLVVAKRPRTDLPPALIKVAAEKITCEAELLSAFTHPHIVKVIDFEPHTNTLIEEHLRGPSLKSKLARPCDLHDAASWLWTVAVTLSHLHSAGVVHGDLHAKNLVFRAPPSAHTDTHLVLIDFGCARRIDSSYREDLDPVGGTPKTRAPELDEGAPPSPASDVYALGVLSMCLFGAVAMSGKGEIPAILQAITQHALAPDPTKRPNAQSIAEIFAAHRNGSG